MTARTLEEIEAEYAKGRGNGAPHMAPLGVMIDNFPHILAIAQEQRAVLQEAKAAMRDMLCGWKIIRYSGGEDKIYGIGWDRAQAKVEAALDKIP